MTAAGDLTDATVRAARTRRRLRLAWEVPLIIAAAGLGSSLAMGIAYSQGAIACSRWWIAAPALIALALWLAIAVAAALTTWFLVRVGKDIP